MNTDNGTNNDTNNAKPGNAIWVQCAACRGWFHISAELPTDLIRASSGCPESYNTVIWFPFSYSCEELPSLICT